MFRLMTVLDTSDFFLGVALEFRNGNWVFEFLSQHFFRPQIYCFLVLFLNMFWYQQKHWRDLPSPNAPAIKSQSKRTVFFVSFNHPFLGKRSPAESTCSTQHWASPKRPEKTAKLYAAWGAPKNCFSSGSSVEFSFKVKKKNATTGGGKIRAYEKLQLMSTIRWVMPIPTGSQWIPWRFIITGPLTNYWHVFSTVFTRVFQHGCSTYSAKRLCNPPEHWLSQPERKRCVTRRRSTLSFLCVAMVDELLVLGMGSYHLFSWESLEFSYQIPAVLDWWVYPPVIGKWELICWSLVFNGQTLRRDWVSLLRISGRKPSTLTNPFFGGLARTTYCNSSLVEVES